MVKAKTDSEVLIAIREAISKEWWSTMNLHALYDKPISEVLDVLDRAIAFAAGSKIIRMKIELLDEILVCKNIGQIFPILRRAHESVLAEMKG